MNSVANHVEQESLSPRTVASDAAYRSDIRILQALELIHNPRISNENRQEASQFLERLGSESEAPYHGFHLSVDRSQPSIVRHFGLSLLESAIRYKWDQWNKEEAEVVKEWVIKLAQSVETEDPSFIRNKIAQLWSEIVKKSWPAGWMDMDESLFRLWETSLVKKEYVLEVLETISESVFGKDDASTALRGTMIGKACVEIFMPVQTMAKHFANRDTTHLNVRCGDEGWLTRISDLLSWSIQEVGNDQPRRACAAKCLTTLKSIVHWAILDALATTLSIQRVCETLTRPDPALQLSAVETLYFLYLRLGFQEADVTQLVFPMYEKTTTNILKKVYEYSIVDSKDIDDEKYLLCKKFSEMIHNVGRFFEDHAEHLLAEADLPNFLDLLLRITQNESLHVSIPILHLWVLLLNDKVISTSEPVLNLIGPLLELCSQRLIRFESLPEDTELPSIIFLNEDIDTIPERHAFLGNYGRFCKDIVDRIVQIRPFEALYHILGQADNVLQHMYEGEAPFDTLNYKKISIPNLKLDAQFSVIEAALLGYGRWRNNQNKQGRNGEVPEEQEAVIASNLEKWCIRLMELTFEDPVVQQRVTQLVVEFATGPLKRNSEFTVRVVQFTLQVKSRFSLIHHPKAIPYNAAVKDLQRFCGHQMQRLAIRNPDSLLPINADMEKAVSEYTQTPQVDPEDRDRCISVLFAIVQRAKDIPGDERLRRLETFVDPLFEKWQDPRLVQAVNSFDGLLELLGLSRFQEYFASRNAHQVEDWVSFQLDEDGKALKAGIEASQNQLPLLSTKTFFSVGAEKLESDIPGYAEAIELWSKRIPLMLPQVIQLIDLAHSFADPEKWVGSPPEARGIAQRIMRDRFWQVGISSGSRDDFYNRIEESKTTLEGLASTIRGALRFVRETGYRLLVIMTNVPSTFRYEGLAEPLSNALFDKARFLSTHQTGVLLETTRAWIERCPSDCRHHFLTPLVTTAFNHFDNKIQSEWEQIEHRTSNVNEDDDLVEEMKGESILRQLTYNAVTLVIRMLDPAQNIPHVHRHRSDPAHNKPSGLTITPALRDFVLETPQVFKSVILFCTHVLRMHDSRACGLITRVLRSLVGVFAVQTDLAAEIREFISTEVFKACITSLHDPYFVDIQSDLAILIADIIRNYSAMTSTPRNILLTLPGLTEEDVNQATRRIFSFIGHHKKMRAVVLKLLEGLRGVSISEMGKLAKTPVKKHTAMAEKYMTGVVEPTIKKEPSPDLVGVAEMFAS